MTNISKQCLTFLAVFLVIASLGMAQTTVTSTTLSAAIASPTATRITVASATGITGFSNGQATTFLFVDREFMAVYSVSGTTLVVQRGQSTGSAAATHANSAKVWVGPYNAFAQGDPSGGSCTAANFAYLPIISVPTGNIWTCANSLLTTFTTFAARSTEGATLTAAATIAPTNPMHHITGVTTVTTVTVPAALAATGGCITLIPDVAGFLTSTGGNLLKGTSTTAGQLLQLCYSPASSKWAASY